MKMLDKNTLQGELDELASLSDEELETKTDKAVCFLMDEIKDFVEGLTCNTTPSVTQVVREARLDYAMAVLKFYAFEKYHRNLRK